MLQGSLVRRATRAIIFQMTDLPISDTAQLISSGLIDSLSILNLVAELEETLDIVIPGDKLQLDDFESIDSIVKTINQIAIPR